MKENIYWTGGFDSTFLVCKRLIVEKKPIETTLWYMGIY